MTLSRRDYGKLNNPKRSEAAQKGAWTRRGNERRIDELEGKILRLERDSEILVKMLGTLVKAYDRSESGNSPLAGLIADDARTILRDLGEAT